MKNPSWTIGRTWALGIYLAALGPVAVLPALSEQGPMVWYRFESALNLGQDSSGQGHHGTVSDAICRPSRKGQGLALEGRGAWKFPQPSVW